MKLTQQPKKYKVSWHTYPTNYELDRFGKNWLPYECDLKTLEFIICKRMWSGCIWDGGKRKQEHFDMSDFCVLDFDKGEVTLKAAVDLFMNHTHIIGPTRSHGINGKDNFRVVIPWSKRIEDLEVYRRSIKYYQKNYGSDPLPTSGAAFFRPCKEIASTNFSGSPMKVKRLPSKKYIEKLESRYRSKGNSYKYLLSKQVGEMRNGHLYQIGCEAAKAGVPPEQALSDIKKYGTLIDWNDMSDSEALTTLRSGFKRRQG